MDYGNLYANFLKRFLRPRRVMKVVFDCSNGTTGKVLKELFRKPKAQSQKLKANVILINEKPDGNFPAHGPDPLRPKAAEQLAEAVKKYKADLGVIFDADGDRVFFVDDKGRRVAPDVPIILMSRNFSGQVLLTPNIGMLAREYIAKQKKKVIDCRIGHYFMKQIMRKKKISFGAEHSGHYYFRDFFYADSGIFAAIQFINAVSRLAIPLSDWIDSLPRYFSSGELNFKIADAKFKDANDAKKNIIKKIENFYRKSVGRISRLDGLRMEFDSGSGREWWFIVRPSNTENLLRLTLEAKNKRVFEKRLAEIKKLIK